MAGMFFLVRSGSKCGFSLPLSSVRTALESAMGSAIGVDRAVSKYNSVYYSPKVQWYNGGMTELDVTG